LALQGGRVFVKADGLGGGVPFADLLKRGCGARAIDVEFFRPYAVTLRKSIRLSRPSRDPVNLFNLLRCAMETVETDVGFLGIQLIVTSAQRISDVFFMTAKVRALSVRRS